MFCDVRIFASLTLVIFATSVKLRSQEKDNGEVSDEGGVGSRPSAAVLCSEAGNCICLYDALNVTVICTSAGDRLNEIASELPQTTTNL